MIPVIGLFCPIVDVDVSAPKLQQGKLVGKTIVGGEGISLYPAHLRTFRCVVIAVTL